MKLSASHSRKASLHSSILAACPQNSSALWSLLPHDPQIYSLRCLFATSDHGWNLDSLYRKSLGVSPCVLLLRSLQQGIVLGAYITVPLSPPSSSVRGDGAMFVFRLEGDASRAFHWAGAAAESGEGSTREQFLVATRCYLAIGGAEESGSNALRIDSDLAMCSAGQSDTFCNPPLAPEERMQPFFIGELELLQLCRGS